MKSEKITTALCVILLIAAISFCLLWIGERNRGPIEIIKEIEKPVEVIKEVEVMNDREIIRKVEVPAKLTDRQLNAINFSERYNAAQYILSADQALYKLDSIQVRVTVNDGVKRVISDDQIRNKFELILRKNGIKINNNSPYVINLNIDGFWNDNPSFLVYTPRVSLNQNVVIKRDHEFRKMLASVWEDGSIGFAGSHMAEGIIVKTVERLGENLANAILAAQEK